MGYEAHQRFGHSPRLRLLTGLPRVTPVLFAEVHRGVVSTRAHMGWTGRARHRVNQASRCTGRAYRGRTAARCAALVCVSDVLGESTCGVGPHRQPATAARAARSRRRCGSARAPATRIGRRGGVALLLLELVELPLQVTLLLGLNVKGVLRLRAVRSGLVDLPLHLGLTYAVVAPTSGHRTKREQQRETSERPWRRAPSPPARELTVGSGDRRLTWPHARVTHSRPRRTRASHDSTPLREHERQGPLLVNGRGRALSPSRWLPRKRDVIMQ